MNIATLDKATDKMIDLMTPIELAVYANTFAKQQAKRLESGNITVNQADKEIDLFVKTHVNRLSPNSYIQYMAAINNEAEKGMIAIIAKSDIRIFDLRASLIEMQINARALAGRWYCALCRQEHPTEEAEKMIEEARQETGDSLAPLFQQLEDIKKEQEEYLVHPAWEKYGVVPEIKERESLLLRTVWIEYAP